MQDERGTERVQPVHTVLVGGILVLVVVVATAPWRGGGSFRQSGRGGGDRPFQSRYRPDQSAHVRIEYDQASPFEIGDHGIDHHDAGDVTNVIQEQGKGWTHGDRQRVGDDDA